MKGALCLAGLTLCASIGAREVRAAPDADGAARASAGAPWARGRLDLRYQHRSTGESDPGARDTDQDLRQDLFVEGGLGTAARAEVSGRLHEDIDGRPARSRFRDLYDTYGGPASGFLYTAYAEGLDLGPLARARAGRQLYGEGIDVRFDGALVETAALADAVKLTAYGGSPVNLFESTRRGDWLVGGAVEVTALPRTTLRLDYAHLTDDSAQARATNRRYGTSLDPVRDDDLFQLEVAHRLSREVRLTARASTFEGRSSRLEAQALWQPAGDDLSARLRYVVQLGAYRSLAIAFAPFDETIAPYEPYHEVLLDAASTLGDGISLAAGAAARVLRYGRDEGPYNHGFGRLFARLDLDDLPWAGLRVSPLGEAYLRWNGERTLQASIDVTQDVGRVRVGGGTSYALYRFDAYFLEEREDVRTVYASVEWRPVDAVRLRIGYDFEVDDGAFSRRGRGGVSPPRDEDRYHVARCDVRLTF